MRNLIRVILIISLLSISMLAYPAEITDSYATGDTLTATTLDTIKGAVNDNDNRISALEASYIIGDTGPAGGWVFYVDPGGRHGLEAAPTDQNAAILWNNGASTNTNARLDGIGSGEMNTMLIIVNQGFDLNNYAAGICANLTDAGVGYRDWYLPSKYELNLMYLNLHQPGLQPPVGGGGFASNNYWSSTEINDSTAWFQGFNSGSPYAGLKVNAFGVRAVRAF
jgi:hypothetical protein